MITTTQLLTPPPIALWLPVNNSRGRSAATPPNNVALVALPVRISNPFNTPYQHTLSPINTPNQHTLYQHTLSSHLLSTFLTTHPINPSLYQQAVSPWITTARLRRSETS